MYNPFQLHILLILLLAGTPLATSSATEAYAFFLDRVRAHLHVVLAFSPIGEAFRARLRMFPSLVNCTYIDWFPPWPEEALRSVASHMLGALDLPGGDSTNTMAAVVDVCVDMQTRVTALCGRFLAEFKRYNYVTPTSFLELLSSFRGLVSSKSRDLVCAKARYENGLSKLSSTEGQVTGMQEELLALAPKLKEASASTDAMIADITTVSSDVASKNETVAAVRNIVPLWSLHTESIISDGYACAYANMYEF